MTSHDSSVPTVAIIIPYFQRNGGLLKACVQSILEQEGVSDFRIIVVDDESPVPAEEELADIVAEAENRIDVICQANAGPGAARNTGLDHVPEGTRFVAFLDSDDQWTGPLLADAVAALERGYDLFFGNSARTGQSETRFDWWPARGLNLRAEDHRLVDREREIYEYQGDFFDLLVRRTSIVGPTTLAYRFDRFPGVRFDPAIFNGQDRLFKLTLGQELQCVAFSPKVYAYEGEGVNIFDKSQWGSAGSLRFLSSYIRLAKTILAEIRLNPEQRAFVQMQLAESRRSFTASILHLLRRRRPVDWPRVRATLREDPVTGMLFVPNALRSVLRWKS